jgi:hypothetical protein
MLNRIKEALLGLVKMAQDKVYTDAELKISEKAIGGKVEIIAADGSLEVAADGDYTMEDGTTFKVKDGVITELNGEKEAPVMEDEQAEEDTPAEPEKDDTAELKAQVEALQQETSDLKQAIEDIKASMSEQYSKEDADKFSKQLNDLTDAFKALLITPIEFSKTTTSTVVKDSKEDKLKEMTRVYASIKK